MLRTKEFIHIRFEVEQEMKPYCQHNCQPMRALRMFDNHFEKVSFEGGIIHVSDNTARL